MFSLQALRSRTTIDQQLSNWYTQAKVLSIENWFIMYTSMVLH